MLVIGGILSAVVVVIILPLALIFGVLALIWILLTIWRKPGVGEVEEYATAASRRKSGPATDHPVFGSMYETGSGWMATVHCPLLAELRSGVEITSAGRGQGERGGAEEVISTPFLKHSDDETSEDGEDPGAFDVFIVDDDGDGPSPEQERAFEFLKENAETVVRNAFQSIHQYYMDYMRTGHSGSWPNPAFQAAVLPDNRTIRESPWLDSPEGIKALIRYPGISIEPVYEDSEGEVADIRLSFDCDWDMEHGLAVLLNEDRVIAVGDATVCPEDGVTGGLYDDLAAAVAASDVQRVRELLEGGADPNGTSGKPIPFAGMHWITPFEQALRINVPTEMIRLFVDHGADLTSHDPDTGLIQAVIERNMERVQEVLGKGAKVDRPCESVNLTPLLAAISIDSPELIQLLAEHGASVNMTKKVRGGWQLSRPLCHAVENDRADSVATLMELGAEVEAVDHQGYPALFKAVVRKPNPQIVKSLLDAGADPNRQIKLPRGLALISESPARRRKREQTPLLYAERKLHQLESMDDTMRAKVGPAYPDFLDAYTAAVELLRQAPS